MSNAIRYDPLLIRYLAEELDRRLRGRVCGSTPFFAARRVALLALDGGEALEMDLHPLRGWIRIVPWEADAAPLDAVCAGVHAPPDERRLTIEIDAADRFRSGARRLEVELMANQWNVLLVSAEDERIHSTLWSRRAGTRALTPGARYEPPSSSDRYGAAAVNREAARRRWRETLGGVAASEREGVLIREFAWTGRVNAASILGSDAQAPDSGVDGDAIEQAFERWWALCALPPSRPVVLHTPYGLQPYPLPLHGYRWERAESLLEAMDRVAQAAPAEKGTPNGEDAALLTAARTRLEMAERRAERLADEVARSGGAERLREQADLLLARLHEVPRGAEEVEISGWDGERVRIRLDPTRSAADNATEWYAEARRRERAAERLPAMLEKARAEVERWREAVRLGEAGSLPDWVSAEIERERAKGRQTSGTQTSALPYRVFRSSGGLEIRVGRNSKANDQLTFSHSSPSDVWMHARSVPGSHVILRWRDPEGAPPARDLEEAARLAAYYSKARTSGIVPVDWTRRKYVRKHRGAPPGTVVPSRVKTLFVEPKKPPEPA
ncbi:MAG TPA: NFACT RNA binding domain-containing protein [Longimicrobiaceae bacterium]